MEAARRFELLDCDYDWLYNGINNRLVKADDITVKGMILPQFIAM